MVNPIREQPGRRGGSMGGVDGFPRLVTHSLLYNEGIHRNASRIPFATLPLKDLRIHHQRIFVNIRIMETAHNYRGH